MQSIVKIRVTNAHAFFRPNRIFLFDPRGAFVTTGRLKNCHTSDAFSMDGIRLGSDWTFYCLTKKIEREREERAKRCDVLAVVVPRASIKI